MPRPSEDTKAPYFFPEDLESKAADTTAAGSPSGGPRPAAGQETSDAVDLNGPTEVSRGPGDPVDTEKLTREDVELSKSDMGSDKLTPAPETENESKQWDDKKTGPSSYALSSQKFLQELQNPKSKYFVGYRKFFRMSDKGHRLHVMINNATWRSDMDTVILDLLRKRAVEALCHFARLSQEQARGFIVKCERWDDVKELKHRGCLLYLGQAKGATPGPALEFVPPRLSSMDVGPAKFGVSKLAVHNLRGILGDEYLEKLRQRSTLLDEGSLFLLGRQATVNLQMLLWKIQGYASWENHQTPP
ncbi:uncharacterized protein C8A04DRAFT_24079 [Dichotomopilus funicola]|uniref:Uncharacterized protein n=1 Tax=Dichotomopilus funicola TaxID=1934379 RepID=A0AAN6VDT4_9PEZI|nr:hypothetical protein C8A04DRAFT_24079 [Dichotomopilus funicola]